MYSCIPPSHPRCAGAREANQEQNSADSDWAGYLLHISRGNFVMIVIIIIIVMIIISPIESAILFISSKVTFVIMDKLTRWLDIDNQDVLVIGLVVVITWCHWCFVFSLFLNLGHTNCSFQVLIGILQRRIELDKEVMYNNNKKLNFITMIFNRQVLFQFTTIKRETALVDKEDKNPTIAPTLMKFQRGCHQVRQCLVVCLSGRHCQKNTEEIILDKTEYLFHFDTSSLKKNKILVRPPAYQGDHNTGRTTCIMGST